MQPTVPVFQAIDPPSETPTRGCDAAVTDEPRVFSMLATDTGSPFVDPVIEAVYRPSGPDVDRRASPPERSDSA